MDKEFANRAPAPGTYTPSPHQSHTKAAPSPHQACTKPAPSPHTKPAFLVFVFLPCHAKKHQTYNAFACKINCTHYGLFTWSVTKNSRNIRKKFAKNLRKICEIFAKNMRKIYEKFTKNLQKICEKFAKKSRKIKICENFVKKS